jgi:A/G-specific adenine glycosylase
MRTENFPSTISGRKSKFKKSILKWFAKEGRDFPWRRSNNPFHILIAEMFLRRTTAAAVSKIYPDFIILYPTPKHLAKAHLSSLEKIMKPLGLQRIRAQQLRNTARMITKDYDGQLPGEYKSVLSLPGIGRYIANAILNFAFDQPRAMVDGNIVHLLNRVFSSDFKDMSDERVWELMEFLGSPKHERNLYWGIMDIVAGICLKKTPRCEFCPLSSICDYSAKEAL